jgi:hypothetical protein
MRLLFRYQPPICWDKDADLLINQQTGKSVDRLDRDSRKSDLVLRAPDRVEATYVYRPKKRKGAARRLRKFATTIRALMRWSANAIRFKPYWLNSLTEKRIQDHALLCKACDLPLATHPRCRTCKSPLHKPGKGLLCTCGIQHGVQHRFYTQHCTLCAERLLATQK